MKARLPIAASAAVGVIGILVVIAVWLALSGSGRTGPAIGGPFTLTDHTGHVVTDQTYKGRWRLVYFGYTYCPDICPTDLQTMAQAVDALGPNADRVVPLFITVDPERDTAAKLASYVALFSPRIVGLTGTPDQIAAAAKAYKVYYAKAPEQGAGGYLMQHSSYIYLMDRDGKFVTVFPQNVDADAITAAITKAMG